MDKSQLKENRTIVTYQDKERTDVLLYQGSSPIDENREQHEFLYIGKNGVCKTLLFANEDLFENMERVDDLSPLERLIFIRILKCSIEYIRFCTSAGYLL